MIPPCPDAPANCVSESFGGAQIAKETRGEASAECFVEDRDRIVVGVLARHPSTDHLDIALVHVGLLYQIIAWGSERELEIRLLDGWPSRPRAESLAQTSFHCSGIEIADDTENNVVGVNCVAVPLYEIVAVD